MKKFLLLLGIAIMPIMFLSSCSDDNNDNGKGGTSKEALVEAAKGKYWGDFKIKRFGTENSFEYGVFELTEGENEYMILKIYDVEINRKDFTLTIPNVKLDGSTSLVYMTSNGRIESSESDGIITATSSGTISSNKIQMEIIMTISQQQHVITIEGQRGDPPVRTNYGELAQGKYYFKPVFYLGTDSEQTTAYLYDYLEIERVDHNFVNFKFPNQYWTASRDPFLTELLDVQIEGDENELTFDWTGQGIILELTYTTVNLKGTIKDNLIEFRIDLNAQGAPVTIIAQGGREGYFEDPVRYNEEFGPATGAGTVYPAHLEITGPNDYHYIDNDPQSDFYIQVFPWHRDRIAIYLFQGLSVDGTLFREFMTTELPITNGTVTSDGKITRMEFDSSKVSFTTDARYDESGNITIIEWASGSAEGYFDEDGFEITYIATFPSLDNGTYTIKMTYNPDYRGEI